MSCSKALTLLGFAAKAGKVAYGGEACREACKNKKGCLLIVDQGACENTKKDFAALASSERIPIWICASEYGAMRRVGREQCRVLAVTDREFAQRIYTETQS